MIPQERRLLRIFRTLPAPDRRYVLSVVARYARRLSGRACGPPPAPPPARPAPRP